jgi:hypothetical protein
MGYVYVRVISPVRWKAYKALEDADPRLAWKKTVRQRFDFDLEIALARARSYAARKRR